MLPGHVATAPPHRRLGAQPAPASHGTGVVTGGACGGHHADRQPSRSHTHSSGTGPAIGSTCAQSTAHCRTNTPTCSSGAAIGISYVVPAGISFRHASVRHPSACSIGPAVVLNCGEQLPGRHPSPGSTAGQPPLEPPEQAGQWYWTRITSHGRSSALHGQEMRIDDPAAIPALCSGKNPRVGIEGRLPYRCICCMPCTHAGMKSTSGETSGALSNTVTPSAAMVCTVAPTDPQVGHEPTHSPATQWSFVVWGFPSSQDPAMKELRHKPVLGSHDASWQTFAWQTTPAHLSYTSPFLPTSTANNPSILPAWSKTHLIIPASLSSRVGPSQRAHPTLCSDFHTVCEKAAVPCVAVTTGIACSA
eukprot:Rhum_TRINITY_DN15460_c2_g4::Rhum_TRINITY_DN15460_c2_g4_i3::g.158452::m.158452